MTDATSIPDEGNLKKAAALKILDAEGKDVLFGSLFEEKKTIAVFIRHFFCGACQDYVVALNKVATPEVLQSIDTQVVLIGSGEPAAIAHYREVTGFKGAIYTNPSRDLYRTLGMTKENIQTTPADQTRKAYLTRSKLSIVAQSIWDALKNPGLIGKQGSTPQLGGEFILGPGIRCTFASRMQHTEDHVEAADLLHAAGAETVT